MIISWDPIPSKISPTAPTSTYSPSTSFPFLFLQLFQEDRPKRRRTHYHLDDSEDYSEGHRQARRTYLLSHAASSRTATRWRHCWSGDNSSTCCPSPSTTCPNNPHSPSSSSPAPTPPRAYPTRTLQGWPRTCLRFWWTLNGGKRAKHWRTSSRCVCSRCDWWARASFSFGHRRNTYLNCWR